MVRFQQPEPPSYRFFPSFPLPAGRIIWKKTWIKSKVLIGDIKKKPEIVIFYLQSGQWGCFHTHAFIFICSLKSANDAVNEKNCTCRTFYINLRTIR